MHHRHLFRVIKLLNFQCNIQLSYNYPCLLPHVFFHIHCIDNKRKASLLDSITINDCSHSSIHPPTHPLYFQKTAITKSMCCGRHRRHCSPSPALLIAVQVSRSTGVPANQPMCVCVWEETALTLSQEESSCERQTWWRLAPVSRASSAAGEVHVRDRYTQMVNGIQTGWVASAEAATTTHIIIVIALSSRLFLAFNDEEIIY